MPRVSKRQLQQDQLEQINEHFSILIATLNNSKEVENFLEQFLTKEEKVMLSKRLVLFMMIKKGYDPSIIKPALNISYETVRSYTNHLLTKNDLFQKTIERLITRERAKIFWDRVETIFKPISLALQAKRSMKARAKLVTGDLI